MQKEPPGGIDTEPDDHGLGRSRGGLITKLHLAVEQGQKPLSLLVTAGQRHDSPIQPILEGIRVARIEPGRPRTRPDKVRADKAYGSRANRTYLRRRGVRCTIPEKSDQVLNRKKLGSRGGAQGGASSRSRTRVRRREGRPWLGGGGSEGRRTRPECASPRVA
ncbi:transposase [Streptomyces sp. NPDC021622]|uniref:transposase n=1 Tax=Streptomyces sp. NPDC021622 TaxID=3155013 RepID=UPI00340A5BE7